MSTLTHRTSIGRSLWLQWVLASVMGVVAGGYLALGIGWGLADAVAMVSSETAGTAVFGAVFGALIGAGLGAGQSLVLRSQTGQAGAWALASALGGGISGAISMPITFALFGHQFGAIGFLMVGTLLGAAIGAAQWLVIRNKAARSALWILASAFAVAVGFTLAMPLGGEGREWLALSAMGIVVGAITGGAIPWLLQQSTTVES